MNAVAGTTQSGFDVAIEMNDRDPLLAPEELSRILELVADASPGPWEVEVLAPFDEMAGAPVATTGGVDSLYWVTACELSGEGAKGDAEYVAYLHPGRVVLMVREIERLQLALARAEVS